MNEIIKGSLDEIVEAVKDEYGKMFHPQEGVKWHPLLEEIVRTALERFVVCEDCGTKPIQSGILTGVCPQCNMKGGEDEG